MSTDIVSRLRSGTYVEGDECALHEEAAAELERLERKRSEWAGVAAGRNRRIALIADERDRLRETLREVYEIWAGMEGFEPQTAPEAYQKRIIEQMRDAVARGLGRANVSSGGEATGVDPLGGWRCDTCQEWNRWGPNDGNCTRCFARRSPSDVSDDGKCWIKGCQQPKGHAGFCDPLPDPRKD